VESKGVDDVDRNDYNSGSDNDGKQSDSSNGKEEAEVVLAVGEDRKRKLKAAKKQRQKERKKKKKIEEEEERLQCWYPGDNKESYIQVVREGMMAWIVAGKGTPQEYIDKWRRDLKNELWEHGRIDGLELHLRLKDMQVHGLFEVGTYLPPFDPDAPSFPLYC
jgi:hypothetical protein